MRRLFKACFAAHYRSAQCFLNLELSQLLAAAIGAAAGLRLFACLYVYCNMQQHVVCTGAEELLSLLLLCAANVCTWLEA